MKVMEQAENKREGGPPAESPPPALPAPPTEKAPLPEEFRLPLRGKMATHTALPGGEDRRRAIQEGQKRKRRKGFLVGLLVGQLLIVGLDLAGRLVLTLMKDKIRSSSPISHEALVFIGMTAGILITALLVLFVLGLQGAGWIFGKKKVGFFTAVGRGARHVMKAAWALGLTLGVIGGTAWFMIPQAQWEPTAGYLKEQGDKALDKARQIGRDLLPVPKQE